jgi:hypothetical protein
MAGWIVLAENTPQVTGSKEDNARTASPGNAWFLAVMVVVACHRGHVRRQAETDLALQSIRPTAARADVTFPEHFSRRFYPAAEFPCLQKIQI